MAMSFMIRKTSHTVVPFAVRAMASPRILTGSIANASTREEHGLVRKSNQYFSTSALTREDHGLVRRSNQYLSTATDLQKRADTLKYIKFLKSELKSAKRERDIQVSRDLNVLQPQTNFPFEIEDNPGETEIKLTREIAGEKIEVRVRGPCNICDDDEEKQRPDRGKFSFLEPFMFLHVKISNEHGKIWDTLAVANIGSILVLIENFSGGNFVQFCRLVWMSVRKFIPTLDRQKTWRAYLAARGIEDGLVDFLMEYMSRKYRRNQVQILKNLRKLEKTINLVREH